MTSEGGEYDREDAQRWRQGESLLERVRHGACDAPMVMHDGYRRVNKAPTFDEIFAVMAASSVGDETARVLIPPEPRMDDVPTRL